MDGARKPILFRTKAPFMVKGRWQWHRWTHAEPSGYAACVLKGRELGAEVIDFGQVTHEEESRWNYGTQG